MPNTSLLRLRQRLLSFDPSLPDATRSLQLLRSTTGSGQASSVQVSPSAQCPIPNLSPHNQPVRYFLPQNQS
ncbi:MAG: hypothetical protein ACYTXA_05340 [Nostoc sp.]